MARSHWNSRNRETDLFVNTPHGGSGKRFDNIHSDTSVSGLWAGRVLMAGHITGNQELTDMSHKTLLAWAKYGWDETTNEPWASLLMVALSMIADFGPASEAPGFRWKPSVHWLCKRQ